MEAQKSSNYKIGEQAFDMFMEGKKLMHKNRFYDDQFVCYIHPFILRCLIEYLLLDFVNPHHNIDMENKRISGIETREGYEISLVFCPKMIDIRSEEQIVRMKV
jgi:hypothetical protein